MPDYDVLKNKSISFIFADGDARNLVSIIHYGFLSARFDEKGRLKTKHMQFVYEATRIMMPDFFGYIKTSLEPELKKMKQHYNRKKAVVPYEDEQFFMLLEDLFFRRPDLLLLRKLEDVEILELKVEDEIFFNDSGVFNVLERVRDSLSRYIEVEINKEEYRRYLQRVRDKKPLPIALPMTFETIMFDNDRERRAFLLLLFLDEKKQSYLGFICFAANKFLNLREV